MIGGRWRLAAGGGMWWCGPVCPAKTEECRQPSQSKLHPLHRQGRANTRGARQDGSQ